eukprot:7378013-Prymnesium_polylepis.1
MLRSAPVVLHHVLKWVCHCRQRAAPTGRSAAERRRWLPPRTCGGTRPASPRSWRAQLEIAPESSLPFPRMPAQPARAKDLPLSCQGSELTVLFTRSIASSCHSLRLEYRMRASEWYTIALRSCPDRSDGCNRWCRRGEVGAPCYGTQMGFGSLRHASPPARPASCAWRRCRDIGPAAAAVASLRPQHHRSCARRSD